MLDSALPANIVNDIAAMRRRIEALEMSGRGTQAQTFIPMHVSEQAMQPDATWTVFGWHAGHTSATSFETVVVGDFVAVGTLVQGQAYLWVPAGHSMEWEVGVDAFGAGGTYEIIDAGAASATGGVNWSGAITAAAHPTGVNDIRGEYVRLSYRIRRTAGAGRVGIGMSGTPYNRYDNS